jgi:prepilin-type N-terminal cleavage/methylation domain-containing protein
MLVSRRRSQGFSLVETIIAMVVIAIALFAILSMTVHSSTMQQSQKEFEIAKEAASRKIDELRGLPWGGINNITIPSVVNSYATVATPVNFTVSGLSYTSNTDAWNTPTNNPLKAGKGTVIVHGTNPTPLTDPVYLVDIEVLIQWNGVKRGLSQYSARMILAKDQQGK